MSQAHRRYSLERATERLSAPVAELLGLLLETSPRPPSETVGGADAAGPDTGEQPLARAQPSAVA